MSRVILFAYTKVFVGGVAFGPTVRVFEIAKALKKRGHEVVIAEPDRTQEETIEGIKFVQRNSKLFKNLSKNFDVAYCQIWDSEQSFLDSVSKIPLIIDVYAPLLVEQSVFFSNNFKKITPHLINAFIRDRFIPDNRILKYGDLYLVASERQRYYYLGILTSLGILNPKTYDEDLIKIVPFGVPEKEPEYKGPIIKGKVVPENKKIIIWPSGIMPWFDAETAIKAMKIVNKKYKNVCLVFVGALSKRSSKSLTYKGFKKAEELAKKLNLLNKSIFFTEWLPYDKRDRKSVV
jgi:glycosyltransferase involved in cell wall biosynthesis